MECALHILRVRDTVTDFQRICRRCWIIFEKGAKIQLHADTDEICSACPNNEKGCCSSFSLVEKYDKAVLELCSLENGQVMDFQTFTDIVQKGNSGIRKEKRNLWRMPVEFYL